jgi:hypothetical protein
MAAVEWADPIRYSEMSPILGKSSAHHFSFFLTCRTLS